MEYKIVITQEDGDVEYGFDAILSANLERPLFDDFSIGNACEAQFSFTFIPNGTIPKMAQIKPYALIDSAWEPLGVFFIDERETTSTGAMSIVSCDAMLKAESIWVPDSDLIFPMSMPDAVDVIAELMGVTVDSRTTLNSDYTIDYPANDYTLRNILQYIAAAHGGNWTMTNAGELRLILVGETPDTTYDLEKKAISATYHDAYAKVTKIILLADDENYYESDGDETGTVLEADCPYATQDMVDALYTSLAGYVYQPLEVGNAVLTPIAELGDGVIFDDVEIVLAYQNIKFSAGSVMDISAPSTTETEHEYQTSGYTTQELTRKLAETKSTLTKTTEAIALRVEDAEGNVSELTETVDSLTSRVSDAEDNVSEISQTVDGIKLSVSGTLTDGTNSYVAITLTVGDNSTTGYVLIDGNVDVSGTLSAEALYASLGDIAKLTVDSLSTSQRIPLYLAGDTSDDNFVRISGQTIEYVAAVYAGGTTKAKDPDGSYLYWEQDIDDADIGSDGYPYIDGVRVYTTTTNTGYPVYVYKYTEQVKRSLTFKYDSSLGAYVPLDTFGAGYGSSNADYGKGFIQKRGTDFAMWLLNSSGSERGIFIGDSYTDITGLRKPTNLNFSSWDSGVFYATVDGGATMTYKVTFDSYSRPIKITDGDGHVTSITW